MTLLSGATRLALVVTAIASLAACTSNKKPAGPVAPTPSPTPPSRPYTPPREPAPVTQAPAGAVTPGSVQDFVINAGDRVYFDLDSFSVRDDAKPILDAQAMWLKRYPDVRVRIEGNCDERGTREYNFALGARRANSVKDYLVARGVAASRIETISYGKEQPIDAGSTEEAWQHNRNAHTAITAGAR